METISFFLFYLFRDEKELLSRCPPLYLNKLVSKAGIQTVGNGNKIKFEPCVDLVGKVYSYYNLNISYNQDSCGQIENGESLFHVVYSNDEDGRTKQKLCNSKSYARIMADGEILESINSLNSKQHVSNVVHNWAREYAKHKDVNV